MQKVLKILFVILILVTLSEIAYYLLISKPAFLGSGKNISASPSVTPTSKDCLGADDLPPIDKEISDKILTTLKIPLYRAKPNPNQKLDMVFHQKGKVKLTYDEEYKRNYITINNEKGEKIFTLGSSYDEYLFRYINGKKERTDISTVREGESVTLIETYGIENSEDNIEVIFDE